MQLFRRIRSHQKQTSSLHQALYKIKLYSANDVDEKTKKNKVKSSLSLPWWCIFIVYGLCVILVGISILFIIARGIEFGDVKTQKWLISILSGFFSSILLTQPMKVRLFIYNLTLELPQLFLSFRLHLLSTGRLQ